MDELGIEKAHVGGWSYGGGPAILLGDQDRERIASVSLIAAMGIQKGEGSGSYMVEHWKYSLLYALTTWVPEAIPHFGLLGRRSMRESFARDFVDCDQRPLQSALNVMEVPVFIIHGKHDPFVPAWVAQQHHRLQPRSRLVILDGSHFFPFGIGAKENVEIFVQEQNAFLAAVDRGTVADLYGVRNETDRKDLRALWKDGPLIRGYKPWWIVAMAGMVLGFFVPRSAGLLAGLAGGLLVVDFMTGIGGVVLGAVIRRGENRTRFHKACKVVAFGILGAIPAALLMPVL
ncbi:MAG: alpha/beta hydrolase [Akkermansiaceae bacterium]|nr:alpha/beta hydrolase [Akkermansiaceae bacterium]